MAIVTIDRLMIVSLSKDWSCRLMSGFGCWKIGADWLLLFSTDSGGSSITFVSLAKIGLD